MSEPNWVPDESARGITDAEHIDGIPWFKADVPRYFHRCTAQTRGWTTTGVRVERCACGATYLCGGWVSKNERRRRHNK